MYVYNTTAPIQFRKKKKRERVHADVRFCVYIYTCMCLFASLSVYLYEFVWVCVSEYKDEKWAWTQSNLNCCTWNSIRNSNETDQSERKNDVAVSSSKAHKQNR